MSENISVLNEFSMELFPLLTQGSLFSGVSDPTYVEHMINFKERPMQGLYTCTYACAFKCLKIYLCSRNLNGQGETGTSGSH